MDLDQLLDEMDDVGWFLRPEWEIAEHLASMSIVRLFHVTGSNDHTWLTTYEH